MRLRELEVLEKIASTGNLNVILGEKGLADRVFNLLYCKAPGLSDWAREYLEESKSEIPPAIKADVIVQGEAFSEFGMRKGNLISSKARVEIQVIDRLTGKVLAIDRQTNVAIDLSEQIAAKRAIQEATADIASRLIPEFVESWNAGKEKE